MDPGRSTECALASEPAPPRRSLRIRARSAPMAVASPVAPRGSAPAEIQRELLASPSPPASAATVTPTCPILSIPIQSHGSAIPAPEPTKNPTQLEIVKPIYHFKDLLSIKQDRWLCLWGGDQFSTRDLYQYFYRRARKFFHSILKVRRVSQARDKRIRFDILVANDVSDSLLHLINRFLDPFFARPHIPYVARSSPTARASHPSSSTWTPVNRIKCISINLNHLSSKKTELEQQVQKDRPDILAVQEHMRSTSDWELRISGYTVFSSPANQDTGAGKLSRGVAVYVRKGIPCHLRVATPDIVAVQCFIGSMKLLVVSIYVPNDRARINLVLRNLNSICSRHNSDVDHTVVLGDFNLQPDKLMHRLDKVGSELFFLKMQGPPETYHRCKRKKSTAIDHILCSDSVAPLCVETSVLRKWDFSDHYAITTSIRIDPSDAVPRAPVRPPERASVERIKKEAFAICRNNRFAALQSQYDEGEFGDDYDGASNLVEQLNTASREVLDEVQPPRANPGRRSKHTPALPRAILKMISARSDAHTQLVVAGRETFTDPDDQEKMTAYSVKKALWQKCTKTASKAIQEFKRSCFQESVTRAVDFRRRRESKSLFRFCNSLLGRIMPTQYTAPVIGADNQLVTHPSRIMEAWVKYYSTLSEDVTGHSRDDSYWRNILNPANDASEVSSVSDDVGIVELQSALRTMGKGRAPGRSGIPVEFYAAVLTKGGSESDLCKLILAAVRAMIKHAVVPPSLSSSILVSIHKKGNVADMNNYRGISLMESLLKIVCTIFNRRLCRVLEVGELLRKEQAGFRRREEGMAQVVSLFSILARRKASGAATFVAFLDFKKAYDRVPHCALFRKLERLGLRGRFIQFVRALYAQSTFCVRLPSGLSEEIPLHRGLRQGCPLSCVLFDVFIDDICDVLADTAVAVPGTDSKCPGLLFADDLVVFAESEAKLQEALAALDKWANLWEMEFGVNKCGVFVHAPDDSQLVLLPDAIQLSGQSVPVVNEYKYLGVQVDANCCLETAVDQRAVSARKALGSMRPFLSTTSIPMNIRLMMLKAALLPVALFGGELFGFNKALCQKLQRVLNAALGVWFVNSEKTKLHQSSLFREADIAPLWALTSAARTRLYVKSGSMVTWIQILSKYPIKRRTAGIPEWFQVSQREFRKLKLPEADEELSQSDSVKYWARKVKEALWRRFEEQNSQATSATWVFYSRLSTSRGYLLLNSRDHATIQGVQTLARMRIYSAFMTTKQLANAGRIDSKYTVECPFCSDYEPESVGHVLIGCSNWRNRREKMLRRIQSCRSILSLKGPSLEDLSQEDAVTLLLGGVADSGVTLEPFWSGCTSANDVSWGKSSPLFLHVAYFLYKVQRRRLRTIYHGLNKTAKSQSPDTGTTAISVEQDASAAASDPGESDAEA